ncbi:hypothetical protein AB4Z46_18945 [Variovorax sp. M-6]|uniref:hypothetical protein n=1 Tax=Variovorax sp. M-6 TaxID=3233041 RepID=UPI003F9D857C
MNWTSCLRPSGDLQLRRCDRRESEDRSEDLFLKDGSVISGIAMTSTDDIAGFMRALGNQVTESNPFEIPLRIVPGDRIESPYVSRLRLMWASMHAEVVSTFSREEPGLPRDVPTVMQAIEDTDAYHSLSIGSHLN